MNFFERKSKIYSLFSSFSPLLRYVFSILIIFIIVVFWFLIFYQELNSQQIKLNAEIATLKKKEILLTNIKQEVKNTEFLLNQLNLKIDEILKANSNDKVGSLDSVVASSNKSGSLILFCSSEKKINKDLYSKYIISFNLKGSFYQLINFLENLSSIKNLIRYKKFNISRINESSLHLECTCKFYIPKTGIIKCSDLFVSH